MLGPAGELKRSPRPPSRNKGGLLLMGGEGKGRGGGTCSKVLGGIDAPGSSSSRMRLSTNLRQVGHTLLPMPLSSNKFVFNCNMRVTNVSMMMMMMMMMMSRCVYTM